MSLYFAYVMVGLAIAMTVGVIMVEMPKQGLENGFIHGWAIVIGGMTIDLLLFVALGILTGILLHDNGLLTIVSLTRKVMNRNMIKWTSIFAGILLFGFACYFIYQFFIDLNSLI